MARITNAGLKLLAKALAEGNTVRVDRFIYANVSGIVSGDEIPGDAGLPSAADLVYQSDVTAARYVDDNSVVYSNVLSSAVGDFEFNWIGLYSVLDMTLVAVEYVPKQSKLKTTGFVMGNTLTKNFVIQYTDMKTIGNIELPAESWQMDITPRLDAMDERERLSNFDQYGDFFSESDEFQLIHDETYQISGGKCYVSGIRLEESDATELGETGLLPTNVYLDAWLEHGITKWRPQISQDELIDFTDDSGARHYVYRIGEIDAVGNVIDKRVSGGLSAEIKDLKERVEGFSGKSIFEVFYSLSSETPSGAMKLEGTLIENCDAVFSDFWSECLRRKESGAIRTLSESEWQDELLSNGSCGAFVVDEDAGSVRLPLIRAYLRPGADDDLGEYLGDAIRNITGNIFSNYQSSLATGEGALSCETTTTIGMQGSSNAKMSGTLSFDASNVVPTADENRPKTVQVCLYIQVFSNAIPASMAQATEFINMLEGKADKALVNVPEDYDFVTSRWRAANGMEWYRKNRSKWTEQGGVCDTTTAGTVTVNLPVPMSDTKYSIVLTLRGATNGNIRVVYATQTESSFQYVSSVAVTGGVIWEVRGVAAE